MKYAISINSVTKTFGSKKALDNISFKVQVGDIFAFLGPNGAGKTTTIRCLMDFIRPTSGTIKVLGLDSQQDSRELKRLVGYVPSDHYLNDKWSGKEHIDFVTELRGAKQSSAGLIDRLDFDINKKVKHLSTGNKQKLAIILAVIGQPKLLVLDEPTQGLDPLFQNEIYTILRDFAKTGGTVFVSSHNLPEVQRLCNNAAIISRGRITQQQSIDNLRALSSHKVSVRFGKSVPIKDFQMDNTTILEHSAKQITLKVTGDLDRLMKVMAKHHVIDLQVEHTSLEEVFLELYQ